MKDDTTIWLKYAEENLEATKTLLKDSLYNPCLHNAQQSVEKALKALMIELSIPIQKTHIGAVFHSAQHS